MALEWNFIINPFERVFIVIDCEVISRKFTQKIVMYQQLFVKYTGLGLNSNDVRDNVLFDGDSPQGCEVRVVENS